MYNQLKNTIKNNSSAFILVAATTSVFLLNILLKTTINASEYGKVALLLTYISLLSSFGLFGSEQLLIRQAEVNLEKCVSINSITAKIIGACFVLQLIFPILYHSQYIFNNFFLGVILGLSVTLNMLTYNIFRISGRLNLSQLNNAAWKLVTLLVITITLGSQSLRSYEHIEKIFVVIQFTSAIFFLFLCVKNINISKIKFTKQQLNKEIGFVFFFFLSQLSVSFIAQGDRLLISEVSEDSAYIGEYLFLGTVIISPYNFLQSYLGFKYINRFKLSNSPLELLNIKLKEVTLISILFTPLILIGLLILIYLNIINSIFFYEHITIVIMMFIISILRMYYSIISSLMGARSSLNKIRTSNVYSILSILVGCTFFFIYPTVNSLVIIFTLLWFSRVLIWYYSTKKDIYES